MPPDRRTRRRSAFPPGGPPAGPLGSARPRVTDPAVAGPFLLEVDGCEPRAARRHDGRAAPVPRRAVRLQRGPGDADGHPGARQDRRPGAGRGHHPARGTAALPRRRQLRAAATTPSCSWRSSTSGTEDDTLVSVDGEGFSSAEISSSASASGSSSSAPSPSSAARRPARAATTSGERRHLERPTSSAPPRAHRRRAPRREQHRAAGDRDPRRRVGLRRRGRPVHGHPDRPQRGPHARAVPRGHAHLREGRRRHDPGHRRQPHASAAPAATSFDFHQEEGGAEDAARSSESAASSPAAVDPPPRNCRTPAVSVAACRPLE